jgi:hypothetical protein
MKLTRTALVISALAVSATLTGAQSAHALQPVCIAMDYTSHAANVGKTADGTDVVYVWFTSSCTMWMTGGSSSAGSNTGGDGDTTDDRRPREDPCKKWDRDAAVKEWGAELADLLAKQVDLYRQLGEADAARDVASDALAVANTNRAAALQTYHELRDTYELLNGTDIEKETKHGNVIPIHNTYINVKLEGGQAVVDAWAAAGLASQAMSDARNTFDAADQTASSKKAGYDILVGRMAELANYLEHPACPHK